MRTIDYLFNPDYGGAYLAVVVTAIAVALLGGLLSPLVVLKRLAFIGQGVSHASFGGVGLAAVVGALSIGGQAGSLLTLGILIAFGLGTAWWIDRLTQAGRGRSDSAIGIVLAVMMAMGFTLMAWAGERAGRSGSPAPPTLEAVLFGSAVDVGWTDAVVAGVTVVLIGMVLLGSRRGLLLWAFDEDACEACGVSASRMRLLTLAMLSVAVVVTVSLAGVVLATALIVLPGAIALRLSDRLWAVLGLSVGLSVFGTLGGVVVGFELDLPLGPAVVFTLGLIYAGAILTGGQGGSREGARDTMGSTQGGIAS